jgi:dTMP kinase
MSGFFLVFEGLDGSGKSAVCARLAAHLSDRLGADRVLHSYEPHDPSAAGGYIRDALAKRIPASTRALALAFALNRLDHRARTLDPFLNGGADRLVVCDRYLLSSLAYQGAHPGGIGIETVALLNADAPLPDLTIFLDASPEVCATRIDLRGGSRELYEERLAEARTAYHRAIAWMRAECRTPIVIIDADPDIDTVFAAVLSALRSPLHLD